MLEGLPLINILKSSQIFYDAGPTLLQHWVCCILSGSTPSNTCHLLNTVSMLAQRLRRWPVFEAALGDCTLFAWAAMRVMLYSSRSQKSHNADNMISWPNADVMLGHCL